jgi:uncharacterized membrane protein YvlD (DUF360 family)
MNIIKNMSGTTKTFSNFFFIIGIVVCIIGMIVNVYRPVLPIWGIDADLGVWISILGVFLILIGGIFFFITRRR